MSVLHVKDGRPDLYSQKQIPNISGGNDVLKEVYLQKYLGHVKIEIGGCIDAITTDIKFVCHPSSCDRSLFLNTEYIEYFY